MKYVMMILLLLACFCMQSCKVIEADPVTTSFELTWTAVGDDGAVGTASQYDGRVATSIDSLTNNWDDCHQWIGVATLPLPSGQMETHAFDLEVELGNTYYFAIKVADEVPNWSLISNIKSITVSDDMPPVSVVDLDGSVL